MLKQVGVASTICADIAAFGRAFGDDVWLALVTEEALRGGDLRPVIDFLKHQPAWSDLPFIILSQRDGTDPGEQATRLTELLGNVTFVERPFRPATFLSVARTALLSRRRQYEARNRIEQLHEGEERLRTALLAGRLGSLELNMDSRQLFVSEASKALFGRRPDDRFEYDDLVAAFHPDDRASVLQALQNAVDCGQDVVGHCRIHWPDGSLHWSEMRARLVRDRFGNNPRLVGVLSDITERKTAEYTLRRLNETLEERVAARTQELKAAHTAILGEMRQREKAEQQLFQAQKMEMIGQLTGGVAHDFNNLLMAVLGNLDLLNKYIGHDGKAARLINSALQGAHRGAALTQRLLAFARRQELKTEPTDMIALVRGMTDLIERSLGTGIDLTLDMPARLPPALVDAHQLELAVLNLVVNARDAMPEGGALSIALQVANVHDGEELASGRYVRLAVTDTGQGMDDHTLRKAIEPFFSTKGVGKGTGLGLSMIQGLAVQLKGALRIYSEVGKGTRAELWLPASEVAVAPAEAKVETEMPIREVRKSTILVVDDDPLIAMSTVDILEDLGHVVIEAHSGETALRALQNGRSIDLMITDYAMPKMNGAQLAAAARRLRPDLPILLATGYAELPEGSTLDLPRIGKPYQQRQLEAEINKLLSAP